MSQKSGLASVEVDPARCQGTGYCEQLAAEIFRLDGENVSNVIREVFSEEELKRVREAEDICPTRAIRVRS